MGNVLGSAGVSIEGGGAFVVDGKGVAHFLFEDGAAARNALEAAGITVLEGREQRLNQAQPGQLGKITRRMAEAGVNIEVLQRPRSPTWWSTTSRKVARCQKRGDANLNSSRE